MMSKYKIFIHFLILLFIVSCGGGSGGSENQTSNQNIFPNLNYNVPAEAVENTLVTLKSTSTDEDGYIESHAWSQISGPEVILTDESNSSSSFIAPEVDQDLNLVFILTITDNNGNEVVSDDIPIKILNSDADNSNLTELDIIFDDLNAPHTSQAKILKIPENLKAINYRVKTRSNSIVNDFNVSFLKTSFDILNDEIYIPVIGLYDDYLNTIEFSFVFDDDSSLTIAKQHQTSSNNLPPYIEVISSPSNELKPSFDYFYIKRYGSPILIDIDGYIRWIAPQSSWSVYFDDLKNKFYFAKDNKIGIIELNGSVTLNDIISPDFVEIEAHHELSKGKIGHFVEVNATYAASETRTRIIESILIEVDDQGNLLNIWDMAKIFNKHMVLNGDDPSNFVIDGNDWCHMNSSIYSPIDDSILISCREDFVAKINYSTKELIWLLGDETKHWYQNFPSLRDLSLNSLDTKPIGQHSLSIHNGDLALFNNGFNSFRQPEGAPAGINLERSRATIYKIDEVNKEAEAVFDYADNIYSDICSSFYSDKYSVTNKDFLLLYTAINRTNENEEWYSLIRGLNENQDILFELKIPKERGVNLPCRDGWNAQIFSSSLIFR